MSKGFHQIRGFGFNETFSPVVKPTTVTIFLSIAIFKGWLVRKLDVKNVFFVNSELKEEVYIDQSLGFEVCQPPNLVCKLQKALYGLEHAPSAWFDKLHSALLSFGFTSVKSYQSLFVKVYAHTELTLLSVWMTYLLLVVTRKPLIISSIILTKHSHSKI